MLPNTATIKQVRQKVCSGRKAGRLENKRLVVDALVAANPIQYEHAPLRVRCAMLRKHPPVDLVLSCLSCFRKPSVGVCQVVSNSPDPGIAWPSTRFRPDL